ncbi:MAG: hypothetical protein HY281_04315 [Nitrospirae bacterium]|nr:hypothetical protein [Nitrospirota bacterium]
MAKLSRYIIVLVLWSFWTVPPSFSGPEQSLRTSPPPPSFEADLLRIDGDRYVIKDLAGVERQVYVGKDTEIFGEVKAGDRIQLWVQPDGHAQTIIIVTSRTP